MALVQRTATVSAGFIPTLWAQRMLDVLRQKLVLAQLVARDTDFTDGFRVGQTLTIPYPGTFVAQDKVEGTVVTPQTPNGGASVSLTLNKHKIVAFSVEDFTEAQANIDLMDAYTTPAIIAIAEQFEADLWLTLLQAGTIAPTGTATTDITAAVIRTVMRRLNEAKAPTDRRSLVLSPKDQAALLGDSTLATLLAYSQPQAVYNGFMGKLYGLDIFWSQVAPSGWTVTALSTASTFTVGGQTTSSLTYSTLTAAAFQTALNGLSSVVAAGKSASVAGPTGGPFTVVFSDSALVLTGSSTTLGVAQMNAGFQHDAVIYAVRQFKSISDGVMSAQVSDPESGLSIRVSSQYDINSVSQRVNVDILYGMQVLRPTLAVPLVA